VWGWDGLVNGERSVLRLLPEHHAAVVVMTNGTSGRAMYRSLFGDLIASEFDIDLPPLSLASSANAAGDLSRFAGFYAWPDRNLEVTVSSTGLRLKSETDEREALPLDGQTFLVDPLDPDNPTVTFGAFDAADRPHVLYDMLWGLPRP
jgi:hypothetical protein